MTDPDCRCGHKAIYHSDVLRPGPRGCCDVVDCLCDKYMTARDDWLEWRRGGIGASDIAGILGLSPWASPWSVWADKANLLPPGADNDYMKFGRYMEHGIARWFEDETGLVVAGEQTQCTHPKLPWLRATVDGFVLESEHSALADALGGLEIKTTGPGARWDEIPAHYQAQGQAQMAVTGLERVWFAVLMGRRLDIHELKRDQADIDYMIDRAARFWEGHVLTGEPPPTDASNATSRALADVYPDPVEGESIEVDRDLVADWVLAKAALAEAKVAEKAEANRVKAALGDIEDGTVDGQRAVSWRKQERVAYTVPAGATRVLRYHPPKETR